MRWIAAAVIGLLALLVSGAVFASLLLGVDDPFGRSERECVTKPQALPEEVREAACAGFDRRDR